MAPFRITPVVDYQLPLLATNNYVVATSTLPGVLVTLKKTYDLDEFVQEWQKLVPYHVQHQGNPGPFLHVVSVVGEFTEETMKGWLEEINHIDESAQPIIPIFISSFGGDVFSFMTIYDRLRATQKPVLTYLAGKALSAGALLFSCGTEGYRWMSPNGTLMIHNLKLSGGADTDIDEVSVDVKEAEKLNRTLYKILARNCGHPEGYFFDLVKKSGNRDLYLSPQESKAHNLTNYIGVPELVLEVKSSVTVRPCATASSPKGVVSGPSRSSTSSGPRRRGRSNAR